MLSNFNIEEICNEYSIPLIGVFMKDELPKNIRDGNYIINLQSTSEGNGTHWTALVLQGKEALFMDSFGAYPSKAVVKFIKNRRGVKIGYNNWIIQSIDSDFCGYFCIALLIYLNNNPGNILRTGNDFINGFNDSSNTNDAVLKSFYSQNTKGKLPRLIQRLMRLK